MSFIVGMEEDSILFRTNSFKKVRKLSDMRFFQSTDCKEKHPCSEIKLNPNYSQLLHKLKCVNFFQSALTNTFNPDSLMLFYAT